MRVSDLREVFGGAAPGCQIPAGREGQMEHSGSINQSINQSNTEGEASRGMRAARMRSLHAVQQRGGFGARTRPTNRRVALQSIFPAPQRGDKPHAGETNTGAGAKHRDFN